LKKTIKKFTEEFRTSQTKLNTEDIIYCRRIYCIIMLGESNQKPYNITLKNVVQTMIKIVIEIINDFEWLSFLEK